MVEAILTLGDIDDMVPHAVQAVSDGLLSEDEAAKILADHAVSGARLEVVTDGKPNGITPPED